MDLSQVLEIAVRSDPGIVRERNEDATFASARYGLAVLADGMGGYNAGEVASSMAATVLGSELEQALAAAATKRFRFDGAGNPQSMLETEIGRANSMIYEAAQAQSQYAGMGTTLVMAFFFDNAVTVAHIGDSRLYRWRGDELQQLTRDHSLLQEQLDSGMITPEQARHAQNRNLVTRALGVDPNVEAEIRDYGTQPGDIYLLCSDGLNDMIEDDEIAMALGTLAGNLEVCAGHLVQMANDNGGRDNVSVILVRVRGPYPAGGGWLARLLARLR
jgi:serine/threonine protein phosphatase PrpC